MLGNKKVINFPVLQLIMMEHEKKKNRQNLVKNRKFRQKYFNFLHTKFTEFLAKFW